MTPTERPGGPNGDSPMTEMRNKNDKPDEPAYPGGEDEASGKHQRAPTKKQTSDDFPVDESDDGPSGPDDIAQDL